MMTRKIFFAFILLFLLITSAYARPRAAIRAFENRTEDEKVPAGAVMDMMVTEINKAGIFDLMERERLDYIRDEILLGQSGLMDPETAPKVGKIKGVQYTMTGAITLYYYDEKGSGIAIPIIGSMTTAKTAYVLLEIRVMNNDTGQIVYTSDQLGTAKHVARGAVAYQGFFIGSYRKTTGGILATATRDAVMKHVEAMKRIAWE